MEPTNKTQPSFKINPVATGIAGAMIGAGITVAATALQDKKNQQKVMHALKKAGNKATKYMDMMKHKAREKKEEGMEKMQEGMKEIKDIKKEAKKAL